MRSARLLPCALMATLALACEGRKTSGQDPQAQAAKKAAEPEAQLEPPTGAAPTPRPKLVVVVVVDQMRFDYFERLAPQWQHGLAHLREDGRFFTAARHQHALTETAPGHATIATGTHPAKHGIVANRWLDRATGAKVNAVDDPEVRILDDALGAEAARGDSGGVSAATLLREGVGDWIQRDQPEAVVISMALKDRAAILLGGKQPDAALWYDDALGGFTSSSYYGDALPDWARAYNKKDRAAALYGQQGWTLSRPAGEYGDSRTATEPELVATFNDYSLTKRFPHVIDKPGKAPRNVIRDTPFGDQMTLELALAAVGAEHMGEDTIPDLLLIGLSGGDYVGHRYGPYSVETHDYYLRLDAALGRFLAGLDAAVGAEDYVLILTSDHGVAPLPEHSEHATAGRFEAKQRVPALLDEVAAALELGEDERPRLEFTHGIELLFDAKVPAARQAAVRAALAERLRSEQLVADVWTRDELAAGTTRSPHAQAWRWSFHPQRSSDLLLQPQPGVASYPEGTGHGTPYEYDQHVPLVIRGPGWAGVHDEPVGMIDLAPTIAALVGASPGAGVDGRAIARE